MPASDLGFPEPPRPDVAGQSAPSPDLEQITAERDRALAEVRRLRELQEATGVKKVIGAIAEGLGAAVAFTLMFGVLALLVAGVMFAFGWRP